MSRSGTNSGRRRWAIPGAALIMLAGQAACERLAALNTPPSVTIVTSGAALRTSPTGEQYYLAGDEVSFDEFVTDPDDDIVTVELFLNEQEYVRGTPVVKPGYHVMSARCVDRSGNESTDFLRFQIKKHEQVSARARLASMSHYQQGDRRLSRAMIVIEIPGRRLEEVDVPSIRLMGKTKDGIGFRLHVDGAWGADGRSPTPENADVRFDSDRLVIVISGLPESAEPGSFEVIGGGKQPIPFMFWQDVDGLDTPAES